MKFQIVSDFTPTGDQPEAIKQLVAGLKNGEEHQTLLGVTGSGKTFTLVKEYLKIILTSNNIFSFQKILAITFTNKATEILIKYAFDCWNLRTLTHTFLSMYFY